MERAKGLHKDVMVFRDSLIFETLPRDLQALLLFN